MNLLEQYLQQGQEELDKFAAFLKEKGNDYYRLEKNGCKVITKGK